MRITTSASLMIFCLIIPIKAGANETTSLVINRHSKTSIVYDDSNSVAAFAARELAIYLKKIIGVESTFSRDQKLNPKADLIFAVGLSNITKTLGIDSSIKILGHEGFLIKRIDNAVILAGRDGPGDPVSIRTETGTLFAVYTFLEKYLGVRWIFPGDLGEVTSALIQVALPVDLNIKEEPAFAVRNFKYGLWRTLSPTMQKEFALWKKRNKMSFIPKFGTGHSYNNHMNGNAYFKEHPEYYALVAGKRRPLRKNAVGAQVCTSNPHVVDIFVNSILKSPAGSYISLSPNDGQGFCECKACRALDPKGNDKAYRYKPLSDRIFTFVNKVARRVREKQPNRLLGIYAYTFLRQPPSRLRKIEDNVIVALTLYSAEYRNTQTKRKDMELVEKWHKLGCKLMAREYHGTYSWFSMPNIQLRQIAFQIPYLKQKGFIGLHSEGAPDWATHGVDYYMLAKLLWNPDLKFDEILADYYEKAYGNAGKCVALCDQTIADCIRANFHKLTDMGWRGHLRALPDLFPLKVLQTCRKRIEVAKNTINDNTIKKRLERLLVGYEYSELTSEYFQCLREVNKHGIAMIGFDPKDMIPAEQIIKPSNQEQLKRLVCRSIMLGEKRIALVNQYLQKHYFNDENYSEKRRRWLKTLKTEYDILNLSEEERFLLPIKWHFQIDPDNIGMTKGYQREEFDDSSWSSIRTDQVWEEQGYGKKKFPANGNEGYNGVAWYRIRIKIPKYDMDKKKAVLLLRTVDRKGWYFLNGKQIGTPQGGINIKIDITKFIKYGEINTFSIKVIDERKEGGFCKPALIIFK